MLEVIAADGKHYRIRYRLCATDATVIECQPGHGQRWRFLEQWPARDYALRRLQLLGNLQPETQPEGGA